MAYRRNFGCVGICVVEFTTENWTIILLKSCGEFSSSLVWVIILLVQHCSLVVERSVSQFLLCCVRMRPRPRWTCLCS